MLRLWNENQGVIKERTERDVVSSIRVGLSGVCTCFILLISPLVRIGLDGGTSARKSYPASYSDIKPTIPKILNIIDLAH